MGGDLGSARMRIGCQCRDTNKCRQYIERNGIYWVKGKKGGRGSLGPEQEGEGDRISTRRGGGRAGGGGLVTDTWVVSEGGCASAVSGDLRSGAPHALSYAILVYQHQIT